MSRDVISVEARNTLGAIQTLFMLNPAVDDELQRLAAGKLPRVEAPIAEVLADESYSEDYEDVLLDVEAKAHEFVKDVVQRLGWDEMQELVAGILRAMGYRTRVSPPGADRGKDIVASPDGLGLEVPRIRVEVKHRLKERIGAPAVRSFIGGLRADDRGLYVSTGGFAREAHYEAERANVPITLVDLDDLVGLLTRHYESLDPETRALVPLTKVYWPVR